MQVPRFKKFPSCLTVAIIGVLNSAASLYYYLRVMVYMYMKDPNEEFEWARVHPEHRNMPRGSCWCHADPGHRLELAQQAVQF